MAEPLSASGRSVWWALLIVGFGWGTGGTMIRWLFGEGAEPFTLITLSTAIAAATLFAALLLSGQRLPNDRLTWRVGAILAVNNVAAFGFFVFMVQNASAGFAGLFAGLSPLATAGWTAYLFEDEELKRTTLLGLLIGAAGLVVLALTRDSGLATGGRPTLALVFGTCSAIAIGFSVAYSKLHAAALVPAQVTTVYTLMGVPLSATLAVAFEGGTVSFSLTGWLGLLYLGVIASAGPFLVFFTILRRTTVMRASLVFYMIPIIAIAAGLLFLDEVLQPGIVLGGLLITAGLVVADRSEIREQPAPRHRTRLR